MTQDLKSFFKNVGRADIPTRLGVKMSSVREAERTNRASARWYWPLRVWSEEIGIDPPIPELFSFVSLQGAPREKSGVA